MKIIRILALALLLFPSLAFGDILEFAWEYDVGVQIEGFRLYQDGVALTTVGRDARTVQTQQIQDRVAHTYFLTAYDGAEESGPSEFVVVPAYQVGVPKILEGTFRVRIIEE